MLPLKNSLGPIYTGTLTFQNSIFPCEHGTISRKVFLSTGKRKKQPKCCSTLSGPCVVLRCHKNTHETGIIQIVNRAR